MEELQKNYRAILILSLCHGERWDGIPEPVPASGVGMLGSCPEHQAEGAPKLTLVICERLNYFPQLSEAKCE
jgi:hypothetical protein